MNEEWKQIQGFEGLYRISNTGKVFSERQMRMMKQHPNSKGYMRVCLSGNGIHSKAFFVHRLVAAHFVHNDNPEVNNVVNHLDCNFLNNSADNLEWTTKGGNSRHAVKMGRMKRTRTWLKRLHESQKETCKAVVGYNPNTGEIVVRAKAIQHVARLGYIPGCVCDCCKGKRMTHKGLRWRYVKKRR